MSMPKPPANEWNSSMFPKHNVQFPKKIFLVKSEAICITAKQVSNKNLRFGAFTSNTAHSPTSLLSRKRVSQLHDLLYSI